MHRRSLVSLLTLVLLAGLVHAGNWPRFRGPDGTGIADDKGIPAKWGPENILWKAPLPGVGHSSPIVWGDRLFLESASADGKERYLLCLDANKGKILWRKEAPGQPAHTHKFNNWASSTPATDGERVYAIFWDGKGLSLHAYDFAGKKVWQRNLGPFSSQHGAGLSPVVYKGTIYLNYDQRDSAELIALDAKTGDVRWKKPRTPSTAACYSAPFIRETGEGAEVVVGSTAGLGGYDARTGKENWVYHWKWDTRPLRTVGSPIVAGGLAFLSSGNGGGSRNMIAVKVGGKGDVSDTHLAWKSSDRRTMPYVPGFLAYNGHLFAVQDKTGVVSCLKIQDGEVIWSKAINTILFASPVLADGKLYVAGNNGKVYVFEAGPELKELARNDLGETIFATPAIANGRIFVRGEKHLFCIGK
jgi:outer membrane protein assembly factor BamB